MNIRVILSLSDCKTRFLLSQILQHTNLMCHCLFVYLKKLRCSYRHTSSSGKTSKFKYNREIHVGATLWATSLLHVQSQRPGARGNSSPGSGITSETLMVCKADGDTHNVNPKQGYD